MKEKELFEQLHKLGKMEPNADWKSAQRAIMLKQIDYTEDEANKSFNIKDVLGLPISMLQSLSQPVMATFLVAFLLLTSGFVGLRASQESKPGESLYTAKIIGEKTQLALTFSDKKKAQLVLEFAVKRAEELKQAVSESKGTEDEEKVEKLAEGLKRDINDARERIERITIAEAKKESETVGEAEPRSDTSVATGEAEQEDGQEVFSAASSRDDNGIEVSQSEREVDETKSSTVSSTEKVEVAEPVATGTEAVASSSVSEVVIEKKNNSPKDMLDQASTLLDEQNYDELLNALSNAGNAFNDSYDKGEVKGAVETADETDGGVTELENEDEVGTSTKE